MTQGSAPSLNFSFAGKRVLLAGGSRGLGKAAAEAFAAAGARVALGARTENVLADVAKNLAGEGHFHRAADFSSPDACREWAREAQAALGGVDLLVVTITNGSSKSTQADYEGCFQLDVLAPMMLLDACRDALIESRGAAIFCSSRLAWEHWPNNAAYGAAKKALEYALRCAAADLAKTGVRVNAIAPGSTMTEGGFWDREQTVNPARFASVTASQPAGRLGTPEDIIPAMLFLGSDAARWITGHTLLVDGGQTLAHFIQS